MRMILLTEPLEHAVRAALEPECTVTVPDIRVVASTPCYCIGFSCNNREPDLDVELWAKTVGEQSATTLYHFATVIGREPEHSAARIRIKGPADIPRVVNAVVAFIRSALPAVVDCRNGADEIHRRVINAPNR